MTETNVQGSSGSSGRATTWDSGLRLDKKTAIVTGSSRGIGAGIAILLGSRGANVVVNYTSPGSKAAADEVARTINENDTDARAVVVHADIAEKKAWQDLVNAALELSPTKNIDILVHNAAFIKHQPLQDVTEEVYYQQMESQVKAPIFLTQLALPHIRPGGRIIFLSSVSARAGLATQTVYAAAKNALEGIARVWASELGQSKGITVNCLDPGPTDTDAMNAHDPAVAAWLRPYLERTPTAARIGEVRDIAPIVGFLASEESRWVTGTVISASGGLVFR